MSRTDRQVNFRIPVELLASIKESAGQNNRTVTAELVTWLQGGEHSRAGRLQQDSPSRHEDKFMVRMPEGMRDRIQEAAKDNNRSMNAEVVARLDASFSSAQLLNKPTAERLIAALEAYVARQ